VYLVHVRVGLAELSHAEFELVLVGNEGEKVMLVGKEVAQELVAGCGVGVGLEVDSSHQGVLDCQESIVAGCSQTTLDQFSFKAIVREQIHKLLVDQ
jgi:hypothetical protein